MLDKPEVLAGVTERPRFLLWEFDTRSNGPISKISVKFQKNFEEIFDFLERFWENFVLSIWQSCWQKVPVCRDFVRRLVIEVKTTTNNF